MTKIAKRIRRIRVLSVLSFTFGLVTAQEEAVVPDPGNVILKTFPIKVSQGVAVDEKWFYAISNTKISKHDKQTGKQIAEWEKDRTKKTEAHFKHLNSGSAIDGKLYCAHSRFPLAPNDCTVEIFEIGGNALNHEKTIQLPGKHGSLTWIDRRSDGTWWMCYAVYGKDRNKKTKLVKYRHDDGNFIEENEWFFPKEVVANWGTMSCSGGSWGPDDLLYVTGHDRAEVYVLEINKAGELNYIRTEKALGIFGQAIAWDRSSKKPVLWGIVRNRHISKTMIPIKR